MALVMAALTSRAVAGGATDLAVITLASPPECRWALDEARALRRELVRQGARVLSSARTARRLAGPAPLAPSIDADIEQAEAAYFELRHEDARRAARKILARLLSARPAPGSWARQRIACAWVFGSVAGAFAGMFAGQSLRWHG